MSESQGDSIEGIRNKGQKVPVVAFYSVSGGVGKSTLARKFAELITVAPGREGHHPNVLLIDLDVEANGLTYRLAKGLRQNCRTVHEVFAEQNINAAQAITVTGEVSLAGGNPPHRGQLYLIPASPPDAKGIFDTIANIDKNVLFRLLSDMISALVIQYDISCVVIDCPPAANPYAAAAATRADYPFFVGRNEIKDLDQIWSFPERFREWYPNFQPAKQRAIINSVAATELYNTRADRYPVFSYIPLIGDVILETEGLYRAESLRMLFFENLMVDIIKQVFTGMNHLIPDAREVIGEEWIDTLIKLERYEEAPKIRHLHFFSKLRWTSMSLIIIGVGFLGSRRVFENLPLTFTNIGIVCVIVGTFLTAGGWYAYSERQRIATIAQKLVYGGPEGVIEKLKEGASHRKELDEMMKLADTIPAEKKMSQAYAGVSEEKD